MAKRSPSVVQWIDLDGALRAFAAASEGVQGQAHIKPLHWYIACRLCIEGGFRPEEITPRPPFILKRHAKRNVLIYDPQMAGGGEQTVLGGLKTKKIDVVVTKPGIGPVVAVSTKGTLNAFRNLTNRLEEAGGDCTNIHLSYPRLVYGFWHLIRANREGEHHPDTPFAGDMGRVRLGDIAIRKGGRPSPLLVKYLLALSELTGRENLRDHVSSYEAVCMTLVSVDPESFGRPFPGFPPSDSQLNLRHFFRTIYTQYDLRFVYQVLDPQLDPITRRLCWDEGSPAFKDLVNVRYEPRLVGSSDEEDSVSERLFAELDVEDDDHE